MTFKVINDEGKEVECEVLFTFESEETKKNYIVYTDNTTDEEGNTKVYASIYNPNEAETKLLPIETEKESLSEIFNCDILFSGKINNQIVTNSVISKVSNINIFFSIF